MTNKVETWPDLTHPNQAQCQWPSYCFGNITCQVCLCITSVHDDLYKCYYFICMYSTLMWCSSKALPICTSNLSKYITTSSCSIYPKVSLSESTSQLPDCCSFSPSLAKCHCARTVIFEMQVPLTAGVNATSLFFALWCLQVWQNIVVL